MKKYLTETINSNWFFVALVFFVSVLPFSQALVSVAGGILLFVALTENIIKNRLLVINNTQPLIFIPVIFLIYLLSALVTGAFEDSIYDLKKTLFYLIIPLAFLFGQKITQQQKRVILYVFLFSIIVSTIFALLNWILSDNQEPFSIHKASLISHIRFSFQLILAFWFIVILIQKNYKKLKAGQKLVLFLTALYLIIFLVFQQSLTGILALGGSIVFFIFYLFIQIKSRYKYYVGIPAILLIIYSVFYILNIVNEFYDIEEVDKNNIEVVTNLGNKYKHDFNNPAIENGRYVGLYVCESEMREEWNKRSVVKYDSIGKNGFPVKATLKRYLTSKGLRKDAGGVKLLTDDDILNVTNGIANVIFAEKKFTLYPRIYQTVWEYYIYSKTGNANSQSFSQRLEYAKAALHIIQKNKWFGVGTANWKNEFQNYYKSNSTLKEEFYASSHNQYLNYMVKFGIIGFLVILFLFVYPIVKTGAYRDILFILFLVFMFFANFADSNFESHMGSSFFMFFYCIFIVGEKDYLELPWKKQL